MFVPDPLSCLLGNQPLSSTNAAFLPPAPRTRSPLSREESISCRSHRSTALLLTPDSWHVGMVTSPVSCCRTARTAPPPARGVLWGTRYCRGSRQDARLEKEPALLGMERCTAASYTGSGQALRTECAHRAGLLWAISPPSPLLGIRRSHTFSCRQL